MSDDVGDISHPHLVRRRYIKVLFQPIGGDHRRAPIAVSTTTIADLGAQPFLPHQTINAVLAAALTEVTQIVGDLAVAIDATAFQPGVLDQAEQTLIFLGTRRGRIGSPGVVAAGMNGHHMAQPANRIHRFVGLDECVPYRDSLAKCAAAFFRMSRSSVTRFSSALRRRISADWPCSSSRSPSGRL